MKKKNMVVIGMVVGCLMMVAGAAWAGTVMPGSAYGMIKVGNLVWLKNANCFGAMEWYSAGRAAYNLKSGDCGLYDGSKAGDWRLPTKDELNSIFASKSLFSDVQADVYWSSTDDFNFLSAATGNPSAWCVYMVDGHGNKGYKEYMNYVWPVRNGP